MENTVKEMRYHETCIESDSIMYVNLHVREAQIDIFIYAYTC